MRVLPGGINERAESDMKTLQEVITSLRKMRADFNIKPSQAIPAILSTQDDRQLAILLLYANTIIRMCNLSSLQVGKRADDFSFTIEPEQEKAKR